MKINLELEIDEEIYSNFENILNKKNVNLNTLVELLIVKTTDENGIDWLSPSINGEVKTKNNKKKNAIILFSNKGHKILDYNTNYSTKNTNNNVYWLNPNKRHLQEDWYIILDDNINKRLYLLFVPPNSIKGLKMRNDKVCNVSITYNDLNFIDIHSGVKFRDYFIDFIDYDSLI